LHKAAELEFAPEIKTARVRFSASAGKQLARWKKPRAKDLKMNFAARTAAVLWALSLSGGETFANQLWQKVPKPHVFCIKVGRRECVLCVIYENQ